MKNIKIYFSIVLIALSFATVSGCSRGQEKRREEKVIEDSREIFAMDTYMTLKAYGENCSKALDEAVEEIERLDEMFSTGNNESEISILNENGSEIFSEEAAYLFQVSREIYEIREKMSKNDSTPL